MIIVERDVDVEARGRRPLMAAGGNRLAGLLLFLAAVQFLVLEGVAAAGWVTPRYSYRSDFVSDLGNPFPNDFLFGHVVNSPMSAVMNLGFVLGGGLVLAAGLSFRAATRRAWWAVRIGAADYCAGMVLAGVFHQQSLHPVEFAVHWIGAFLIALGGNLAVVAVGLLVLRGTWTRAAVVLLGVVGILAFVFLAVFHLFPPTDAGMVERISAYSTLAFFLAAGSALIAYARRATA